MSKVTQTQRGDDSSRPDEGNRKSPHADISRRARQALSLHSQLRAIAKLLSFELEDDVLVVRGSVVSFYLKQLLQTALKDLDGVRQIDNQVEVIGANGLGQESYPSLAPKRRHL
jgi:hypothetical protein